MKEIESGGGRAIFGDRSSLLTPGSNAVASVALTPPQLPVSLKPPLEKHMGTCGLIKLQAGLGEI